MKRLLSVSFVGTIVSFYLFSVSFTFLPQSLNTKIILAVIGLLLFSYYCIRKGAVAVSKSLVGAVGIAVLFSFICFYATDYNYTTDYAYATYITSFAVWLFAAFTVCYVIHRFHGQVSFKLLTYYLAGVSAVQCILAILIDRIPAFKQVIDTFFFQGQGFFDRVDRLYGIGAALDPAGVRFSIVLLMIAALLVQDKEVRASRKSQIFLILSFLIITIIGNMIARTTTVGLLLALAYFVFSTGVFQLVIRKDFFKLFYTFGSILVIVVGISIFLYNQDATFHQQIRFAFEGFFNWMETGVWRTDSTDKLNKIMWVWPTDLKTWIIGTGLFDNWAFGTDIGYCRFILYSGIIGLGVFSLFFIYNAIVFANRYPQLRIFFLFLLAMTFIIWMKVATDLFFIYALFYCMTEGFFKRDDSSIRELA